MKIIIAPGFLKGAREAILPLKKKEDRILALIDYIKKTPCLHMLVKLKGNSAKSAISIFSVTGAYLDKDGETLRLVTDLHIPLDRGPGDDIDIEKIQIMAFPISVSEYLRYLIWTRNISEAPDFIQYADATNDLEIKFLAE